MKFLIEDQVGYIFVNVKNIVIQNYLLLFLMSCFGLF